MRFCDFRMYEKLIISYILVSLIPILILGSFAIIHFRNFASESISREIYNNLETIKLKMEEMNDEAVNIANKLMIDQRLKELLLHRYKTPLEAYLKYSGYKDIENYKTLYAKTISHIRIYSENPTILENGIFYKATKDIRQQHWYKLAHRLNGFIRWELIYEYKDLYPQYYLSLVRLLRDVYNEKFGVLVINLNKLEINKILRHQPFDTFVVNNEKLIVASSDDHLLNTKLEIDLKKILGKNDNFIYRNGKKYKAIGIYLPLTGDNKDFYIVSMVPFDLIMGAPIRMQNFAIFIIIISFLASIFLIFIFSRSTSKRLSILTKAVREISHGSWDLDIPLEGRDEFAQLSEDIKNMAKNIKKLIEEVYIANIQKNELLLREKEIKLKLLTNQLNPHFLFNTLETLHMMAICNGQKDIADMVLKLGNILRKNIELKGNLVKLETELNLVRDYLEIQKYRFGKINYKIETHVDPSRIYILPFLIQPIVENSIIHGLENKIDEGFIYVKVKKEEERLIISIEDNGVGMEKETLESLMSKLSKENNNEKIGLRNIWERIKLYYGEEYELKITSEKEKGTKVDIIIPYIEMG
ncbi:MAG: sensor histidine kinase [Dictyoglomus sp.]|nr:sensor histidine kinase [Dictyoglomus sp.]MDW8188553.1 sensor histidine kinase [Dictyoglomus sp.]